MRIMPKDQPSQSGSEFMSRITRVLANSGVRGRVCSDECTMVCSDCGSMACQCMCRYECPYASEQLSSDPDHFPIEPGILPLVFEMKRDGTCAPCWSCEGHTGPNGKLWKIPRVWFYCSSAIHLRLIGSGVHALFVADRTHMPWQVVVTHSDPGNPDTTYSLEPALTPGKDVGLADLQKDILTIAQAFSGFLKSEARVLARSQSTRR